MFSKIKTALFKNAGLKQRIAKNIFWLNLGEILGRIIRFGIVIYSARLLAVAGFGIFSYAISLAAFLTIASDIGIGSILTRELSKKPEQKQIYLSSAFITKTTLLILITLIILLFHSYFIKIPEVSSLIPIIIALLIFDSLREFCFPIVRAQEKMQIEAGIKILVNATIVILALIVLKFFPSPYYLVLSYVAGSFFGLVAFLIILKEYLKFPVQFRLKPSYELFNSSWRFALYGFLPGIMCSIDLLMLGYFKTAQAVGFYSAAHRPIHFLSIIPTLLAAAFFPNLARLAKQNNQKFRYLIEKGISLAIALALPLTVGGIILGKEIISLVYGEKYLNSILPFQILIISILISYPLAFLADGILAFRQEKQLVKYFLIGLFANIILDLLLIPNWGAVGCSISTAITLVFCGIFAWFVMKRINYFSIFPYLSKIVLALIIMTGITLTLKFIGFKVILNILISAIIYFLSLLILTDSTKKLKSWLLN